MHVDTARSIDYYAGIPLCALATLALKLAHRVKKPRLQRPTHVLLIELSEMGSAILADPAMEELKRHGAVLYFLIFKRNAPSLHLLNTVTAENIFSLDDSSLWRLIRTTWQFLHWARARQIDSVIDLELFSRFTALLTGLSGACQRVGFYKFHNEGLYRGDMLTRKVAYNPHIHIARNFFSLVHALYAKDAEWPFAKITLEAQRLVLKKAHLPPELLASVGAKITRAVGDIVGKRLVLINANASDLLPQRHWGVEHFCALIQLLLAYRENVLVLLTGAPNEHAELEGLRQRVKHERCVNLAGVLELPELPALYALSACMVTNDSGPAHFAAVTSLPTFVLFGPETPALYGPLGNATPIYAGLHCSPCVSAWNHRKSPCRDNKCLQVITPQVVFDLVRPVLDC
jgi:ADP-heptose:LPS heptosyltransferase